MLKEQKRRNHGENKGKFKEEDKCKWGGEGARGFRFPSQNTTSSLMYEKKPALTCQALELNHL